MSAISPRLAQPAAERVATGSPSVVAELVQAKARIGELTNENIALKRELASQQKPQRPPKTPKPPIDPGSEVVKLTKKNKELRAKIVEAQSKVK